MRRLLTRFEMRAGWCARRRMDTFVDTYPEANR